MSIVIAGLLWFGNYSGVAGFAPVKQAVTCSMQVWINQSVDKVAGRPWPRHGDGTPLGMTMTDQPCETEVHLPSGRVLKFSSKSTTLEQEKKTVTLVSVMPLPSLVDFPTAAMKIEQFSNDFGIQDRRFNAVIASWKDLQTKGSSLKEKYTANTTIERGVDLSVELRAHPTQPGWFIVLNFEGDSP